MLLADTPALLNGHEPLGVTVVTTRGGGALGVAHGVADLKVSRGERFAGLLPLIAAETFVAEKNAGLRMGSVFIRSTGGAAGVATTTGATCDAEGEAGRIGLAAPVCEIMIPAAGDNDLLRIGPVLPGGTTLGTTCGGGTAGDATDVVMTALLLRSGLSSLATKLTSTIGA